MDTNKLLQWIANTLEETKEQSKRDVWAKGYRSALADVEEMIKRGDFDSQPTERG